ncbi:hypothetical protein AB0A70_08070 [Streptomyces morookaense]|uniref:hypothetical protein n=1 Tax=Streptomyces morookaense TaxID=1970 RepID=UPI003406F926
MIDVSSIPDFSGDLEQLEKDAGTLKKAASDIRSTGGEVHTKFQGLKSCYTAPEAEQLFATTLPVQDGADKFATKLESVSSALSTFASDARPLVSRMAELKSQAEAFCKSVEGKKDWQKDQSKVDKNASLVHEVGRVWGEFQEAERKAAGKISDAAGSGTKWTVDDGSHKKGMYGFSTDDAAKADDTPWGKVDKRKYEGLEAAWHWTTDHVGSALKGFFVDGVWGTLKGLGNMVNVFDWDTFKKTWSGIGDVFGGVSAYIMTPYDWAMDKMFGPVDHSDTDRQKKALRDFGKSLVAWDEWGKNPTRAGGTVLFNVLTIGSGSLLKLGKAGSLAAKAGEAGEAGSAASKVSAAAKVANALGKTGRLVDPMTYVGKAGEFVKLQVGDLMSGMKNVYKGTYTDFLNGTGKYRLPETSVKMPDGSIVHHDGRMELPDGKPSQKPVPVEPSAAERAKQHPAGTPSHDRVPAGVGAGHGGDHPAPAPKPVPKPGPHLGGGGHGGGGHGGGHGGGDNPAPKPVPKPGPHLGGGGGGGHVPPGGHGGGGHGGGGGGGDHGGGGHDGGGTPPPPHEGGTYNPGPDDKIPHLQRQDDNFGAEHNRKGQRKSHLNADGDLVPADPNGDASIVDHIVGRDPKKSESPYTSLSEDGADAKDYGGKKIRVDLPNLVKDIADGKVKGVEVYSPKEVEAAIQQSADKIAGEHVNIDVPPGTSYDDISKRAAEMAKEHGWGKAKTKRIEQRIKDMMHTRRDSEWLIKGVVPHEYIHEAS